MIYYFHHRNALLLGHSLLAPLDRTRINCPLDCPFPVLDRANGVTSTVTSRSINLILLYRAGQEKLTDCLPVELIIPFSSERCIYLRFLLAYAVSPTRTTWTGHGLTLAHTTCASSIDIINHFVNFRNKEGTAYDPDRNTSNKKRTSSGFITIIKHHQNMLTRARGNRLVEVRWFRWD